MATHKIAELVEQYKSEFCSTLRNHPKWDDENMREFRDCLAVDKESFLDGLEEILFDVSSDRDSTICAAELYQLLGKTDKDSADRVQNGLQKMRSMSIPSQPPRWTMQ